MAQRPADRKKAAVSSAVSGDIREAYIKHWVEDYNKHGKPIISIEFLRFRTLSDDLVGRLERAFPRHQLTIVDTKVHHNGSWDESFCLLQDRKSGNVIGLYGSLNAYNEHSPDPYSVLLSSYRANNKLDALSKASTLMDLLVLVGNDRILHVNKGRKEFTFLVCSNTYSITDLGQTLHVPFTNKFAFGRSYFEHNAWERNKCPVLGAGRF